ncbi:MAG: folate-binding protein YgfZ [Burkholderiales bacterium]|nr:folate-binding protein YgfZ [Burkholderiales bacterium]
MQSIQIPDTKPWNGAVALPDLGIITAQGADTATFLHGQFSQDMANQPAEQARLAAYCSPKGRMLASFQSLRLAPDTYWLLTDLSVLPATLKRLSMFVLRSKVKLQDAAGSLCAVGLAGASAEAQAGQRAPGSVWLHEATAGWLIRLPDVVGAVRCLWVGPADQAASWLTDQPALSLDQWNWLQVASGVPNIQAAGVDQFVPQMVNYELVGGVNFSKGCYPGQEIVARSQYRGTLKRRAFVMHAAAPLTAGQEVFSEADPGQPAGMVVNAAPMPGSNHWSALVELKLNALDTALHAGAANGALLSLGQLPYAIPASDPGE